MKTGILFSIFNLIIICITFYRNIFYLDDLSFAAIGAVALFQSAGGLLCLIQLGYLNGVFRRLSAGESIADYNYSFLALLSLLALVFIFTFGLGFISGFESIEILLFSIAFCFLSLLMNWCRNYLIAKAELSSVSMYGVISIIVSLIFMVFTSMHVRLDFFIVATSVLMQPLIFSFLVVLINKPFSSFSNNFSFASVLNVVKDGFPIFIASAVFLSLLQLEKLLIAAFLSDEVLGTMTLIFLLGVFWQIVPESFSSVFYPKYIQALKCKRGKLEKIRRLLKSHTFLVISYSLIALLLHSIFTSDLVDLLLPKFSEYNGLLIFSSYVYLIRGLITPFSCLLNSLLKKKEIYLINLSCLMFYVLLMLVVGWLGYLTPVNALLCMMVVQVVSLLCSLYFTLKEVIF